MLVGSNWVFESTSNGRHFTLLGGPPVPIGGGRFRLHASANIGQTNSLVYGGMDGATEHADVIFVGTDPRSAGAGNAHALWVRQAGDGFGAPLAAVQSFTAAAGALVAVRDVVLDPATAAGGSREDRRTDRSVRRPRRSPYRRGSPR